MTKHIGNTSGKLFRGRHLILMKLKPHVLLTGSSTNSPFRVFLSIRGPKIAQAWQKSVGARHSLFECVFLIWGLYIILRPLMQINDCDLFWGCKVGQSIRIGMILELDLWHHPLNVYARFQTDISKHVQKIPEFFSLAGSSCNIPFQVFLSTRGPKLPNHD